MIDLGLNFKLIKPKKITESDKYSNQIYKFLIKNKERLAGTPRVYYTYYITADKISPIIDMDYFLQLYNNNELNADEIYFGKMLPQDQLLGNRLFSIIGYRPSYTIGCYTNMYRYIILDITDWFWQEYIKIGRCIYDIAHNKLLPYTDDRFKLVGKTKRVCKWCGLEQKLTKEKVINIKEKWVNI